MKTYTKEQIVEALKSALPNVERDWEKIAGDGVQLALEPPTEEEARAVHADYIRYSGTSIPSMLHALRRFVKRRSSAVKPAPAPAPAPPQFKVGDWVRLVRTDGLGKLEFEFANKVGCIVSTGDISQGRLQLLTVRFDGQIRAFFAWRFDVVSAAQFKVGDRVCLDKGEWNVLSGTVGTVMSTSLDDLEEVDFRPAAPRIFVPRNRLHLVEPAFKVGDRVRVVAPIKPQYYNELGWVESIDADRVKVRLDFTGASVSFRMEALRYVEVPELQFKIGDRVHIEYPNCSNRGQFGCVSKVVAEANYIVQCDNGSVASVRASWLKSAPQFEADQRVRVRATGQVARIEAVLADGRFMVKGSAYGAVGLEPVPFKAGDRVRWCLSSGLPFCHGQVEYLSDERVGVRIDGQLVEVAERLLKAEPISWKEWSGIVPLDPANYQAAKQQFKAGDRVKWMDEVGTVSAVLASGKVNVALDKGGWLNNYSPDGFELLGPAEPRTFIKHFLERVCGQEFTHEEAELLRTHIAIRERTPKPTELRCPFCGGTGSLSRNGNLWRLECIGCGAEVTAAANEDCKSKWERRN